mmetsp:Transcript_87683/g.225934  ORF Transcript_87683/g.225934 Transcript_87683/m.225934 type:complete len:398 (+) Transcript_87683:338-1531(+)
MLLGLALPLGFLLLHLHLDDALELVALGSGLLAEAALLLRLLALARDVQLLVDGLELRLLLRLLGARGALRSLRCALRAEGVHLSGLVLGLLLHGAQPGRLLLLLGGQLCLLRLELALAALLVRLVVEDLLLLQLVRKHLLLLDLHGRGVGLVDLLHQALGGQLLLLLLLNLLALQGVDLLEDEGALLLALLLLAHALGLAILDLLDDHLGAGTLALEALLLAHLVHAEGLQPLNLHHGVQLTLLLLLLRLHVPLLLDLSVADGDDLGVKHHLVHVLHVIHVLIHHVLRPLQHAVLLRPALRLALLEHRVLLPLLLHHPDLLLPGGGLLHALGVRFLLAPLLLHLLLLRESLGVVAEPVELGRRNDDGILLRGSSLCAVVLLAHHHGVLHHNHDLLV